MGIYVKMTIVIHKMEGRNRNNVTIIKKAIDHGGHWILFIVSSMIFLGDIVSLINEQAIRNYISFILTLGCWLSSIMLLITLKREKNKKAC